MMSPKIIVLTAKGFQLAFLAEWLWEILPSISRHRDTVAVHDSSLGRALTKQQDRICELLCKFGREEILKWFKVDSCIASTKVAIKVLSHFRIGARPQACMFEVMNPKFVELFIEKGYPKSKEEGEAWLAAGAYSVAIDDSGLSHVVAIVLDSVLIDLSIDQACRPHKQIALESAAGLLPADFMQEGVCYAHNGCRITYLPIANEKFRKSNDWRQGWRTDDAAKAIIRKIRRHL
jgi:hypothetical protein